MQDKNLAAKWIVKKVIVQKWGVVVPLRIDPTDGSFWFEYPEGKQYVGFKRSVVEYGIQHIVEEHHTAGTWTQHIAAEELVNTYKLAKHPDRPNPPHVGFSKLYRFERSTIELLLPSFRGDRSEAHMLLSIKYAQESPDSEFYWRMTKNVSVRPFTGDDGYLHLGDSGSGGSPHAGKCCKVFDYSDELWARFTAIHNACASMHGNLHELMMGTPDEIQTRFKEAMLPLSPLLGDGR